MSVEYDQYLSQHFRRIATPAAAQRNAVFSLDHHGQHFPPDKNAAILEIGPGLGALLGHLHTHCGYRNIKAVDVCPEVVEACNKILPRSTELTTNTTAFLQDRPGEFDLILGLHVLEHVPKDEVMPLLKAVRRSLRENGKLVVEVPNIAHPVTGTYIRYCDFTHTVGFTDQSLGFVLRNSGFQDVMVYGCRTPRRNPLRLIQRAAQDAVELFSGLRLRLYLPRQPTNLATALGACGTK